MALVERFISTNPSKMEVMLIEMLKDLVNNVLRDVGGKVMLAIFPGS